MAHDDVCVFQPLSFDIHLLSSLVNCFNTNGYKHPATNSLIPSSPKLFLDILMHADGQTDRPKCTAPKLRLQRRVKVQLWGGWQAWLLFKPTSLACCWFFCFLSYADHCFCWVVVAAPLVFCCVFLMCWFHLVWLCCYSKTYKMLGENILYKIALKGSIKINSEVTRGLAWVLEALHLTGSFMLLWIARSEKRPGKLFRHFQLISQCQLV